MATDKTLVLYRAVKFQLHLTDAQEKLLLRVSDGLREIYNWALAERVASYELYKKWKKDGGEKPQMLTLFDQINALTDMRAQDKRDGLWRAKIPRNWQEETLDALDGAFRSFFALVKNGDAAARPPWQRREHYFCEVPGRSGISVGEETLVFAPNIFGKETLRFPIPKYCRTLLRDRKVKKFTLFRDEALLSQPGCFWVSVVYEMDAPQPEAFRSDRAVFIAVGASWLGVVYPDGEEELVKLWRPDKHWKPHIDALEGRLKNCTKGSRAWRKRVAAARKMYRLMAAQQKQNQREVVKRLLERSAHFVVEDLVIRGGLADGSKPERAKLNWGVQNTGSIARLVAHLGEKAKERGGFVVKHKPSSQPVSGRQGENKIPMAHRLKRDYLETGTAA